MRKQDGFRPGQRKTAAGLPAFRNAPKKHNPWYTEFTHETKDCAAKQVFIDLDDAYGVPFSSGSFRIQNH